MSGLKGGLMGGGKVRVESRLRNLGSRVDPPSRARASAERQRYYGVVECSSV